MHSYLAVKHLHITCAAISGSFFMLRAYWKMRDAAILQRRWVRILPHLIDTLLLASALTLVYWSGQYPFQQNWLTAKVLALLAYISLGTIALKRGKSARIRAYALVGAMLTFGYILAVAISRQAMPF